MAGRMHAARGTASSFAPSLCCRRPTVTIDAGRSEPYVLGPGDPFRKARSAEAAEGRGSASNENRSSSPPIHPEEAVTYGIVDRIVEPKVRVSR